MMRRRALGLLLGCCVAALGGCSKPDSSSESSSATRTLEVFVGSASKPPTEEAVDAFEKKMGVTVEVHFGGSGAMLSQMKLSDRGDVFFPGSSDYMELAKQEGLVVPTTEKRVVYLIPAINVQRGNPKGIHTVEDLAKPGIRVGIARPDTVCVGLYAVEVLESMGLSAKVQPNVVTQAPSCEKVANLIALKSVDAVMGWRVFEYWDPENIETVFLPKDQVPRIGYIPAAVATSSKEPELAQAFIDYLVSEEGQAHFKKWKYITSEAEARTFATATTPVGGTWSLPAKWTE